MVIFMGILFWGWDVAHASLEYAQEQMISLSPAIANNPYKDTPASVRIGNDLSVQEQNYLATPAKNTSVFKSVL